MGGAIGSHRGFGTCGRGYRKPYGLGVDYGGYRGKEADLGFYRGRGYGGGHVEASHICKAQEVWPFSREPPLSLSLTLEPTDSLGLAARWRWGQGGTEPHPGEADVSKATSKGHPLPPHSVTHRPSQPQASSILY